MFAEFAPELEPVAVAERRRSILVVDDDHGQVEALTYRLKQQGYRTFAAESGRYGLEVAMQQRPDLILLDLRLPDADGFDVCGQLNDHPDTCFIPVIIVSGMERPDIIRQSRSAGCQYYVRKPYDPNALLILIEQAIEEADRW